MNGVTYFQTAEKRGIFLRPEKLEIEILNQPTSPAPASPTQRADSERSVYINVKKCHDIFRLRIDIYYQCVPDVC